MESAENMRPSGLRSYFHASPREAEVLFTTMSGLARLWRNLSGRAGLRPLREHFHFSGKEPEVLLEKMLGRCCQTASLPATQSRADRRKAKSCGGRRECQSPPKRVGRGRGEAQAASSRYEA